LEQQKSGRSPFRPTREEFCRFCRLLYERHLVSGVGGNISARAHEGIFVTPSGFSLRDVEPENVVLMQDDGKVMEGGTPTKDRGMHLNILNSRPDINVVCHAHGAYIIAASAMMEPGMDTLSPLTPGFVYLAHPLEMLPFMVPGTKELARRVSEAFGREGSRALLLQNHGLVSVGRDFEEAVNIAEEVDEAARIFVLTGGKAGAIPAGDLEKIKQGG
jgi:ribulose-5-phosphate 4-epimerase/fuculose-1-phosphate aldolase